MSKHGGNMEKGSATRIQSAVENRKAASDKDLFSRAQSTADNVAEEAEDLTNYAE